MSINPPNSRVTFADYLTYFDGSDTRYELVNGNLIPIAIGTGQHGETLNQIYKAFDSEINKYSLLKNPRAKGVIAVFIKPFLASLRNDILLVVYS